ncbi:MAG TPA: ABC transporter ATP-binding protein [Candidatus Aveggerthella excrementigallinarum]|nr:ABC transporter ATP-binding protein [Candidatus Aveggerthella excrementigallinarum]
MRIVRYLKMAPVAVLLILCLLVVQAFTDLSLPRYTSDIVDVGIQQSGIEHAAVDEMTAETFEAVCMMASEDDEATLRAAYEQGDDGAYHLTAEGASDREALDKIVEMPLVAVHYADQVPDFDLAQVQQAYDAGLVTKGQISEALDEMRAQMGDLGDSIVAQQAVAAARDELEAAGVDVSAVQMGYLLRTGGIMLGLAALGMAASIGVGFLAARTAARIGRTLRGRLFRRVVTFSDAEVQSFSAASLITRATNDVQQIQMVSVMLLRMVVYAPILAIGGIVMVSSTNVSMAWIIVLAVVCLFVVIGILMALAMPRFKIMQKLIDRVNLVAREMLTGLPVIRAFDRQRFEEERFDGANTDLMRTQLFTNRVMTFMMPAMMLIMNGVSVLIVWVGGSYIDNGTIQTGDMIAFITYSMVIIMSFLIIGMVSIMLPRANVAAERVDEVLAARSSIEDPAHPRDGELPTSGGAEIAFHDVTFSYSDAEGGEPVLSHLDFTVPSGTTCAFIGSTGSGKSTVAKLVMRFYDVTDGSVAIDGVDVRELSQAAVRRTVGYVPQKAFLFSGTVASNIAYADEGLPEDRVREAARIAQAADFVEAKDEGYDAPISQGGTNVSGGQRQRLAIARAVASNARALLFDDSFSALDYRTDARLRAELAASLGDRTLLIVAQRVSTIMDADQIVVLEDGRMVGKGTHRELLETCDAYREIALSQLSEEELKGGEAA